MRFVRLTTFILAVALVGASAQSNLNIQPNTASTILINQVQQGHLFEIYQGQVKLAYTDYIGVEKSLTLSFYDNATLRGVYTLDKVIGLNQYAFNLADLGLPITDGLVYRCEVVDEHKTKWEWSLRCAKLPEVNKPTASIQVKPVYLACQDKKKAQGSLIEFYGKGAGGSGSYTLNWYVINDARTEFLNQPKEDKIQQRDVSMIRLDHNPVYHVMLVVTDACGNIGKQMVRVSCSPQRKKINTLVVEPLERFQTLPQYSAN